MARQANPQVERVKPTANSSVKDAREVKGARVISALLPALIANIGLVIAALGSLGIISSDFNPKQATYSRY